MSKGKVIVAMSGGVDSSVAALLLHRQGYDVVGVTMRLWGLERDDVPAANKRCCSVEDVDDARRVCHAIGVPHYFVNFEKEFQSHVIDYFVQEYDRGRTPHPCLACNDKIKFDFLLRRAMFLDADFIATGHYGRVSRDADGRYELLKGMDAGKDQSYVLFTLGQSELSRLLLPVGEYPKEEIRKMAAESGLLVANKPDSQEICFIPNNNYREFVAERVKPRPGNLINLDGEVLGTHPGIQFFTIGQRRGLGLNGNAERPLYVTRIDAESNEVVLGDSEDLLRTSLWASRVNYICGDPPGDMTNVTAKIRYKAAEARASVIPLDDDWAEIRFDEPQRAVTPGQAVVFYDEDRILGGGYIELEAPVAVQSSSTILPNGREVAESPSP